MSSNIRVRRVCEHCNRYFTAKTSVTKYCSDPCAKAAYKLRKKQEKIEQSIEETNQTIINKNLPADDKLESVLPELTTTHREPNSAIRILTPPGLNGRELIDVKGIFLLTGIGRTTIFKMLKEDQYLPRMKVGRKLLFHKEKVLAYIESKYGNFIKE